MTWIVTFIRFTVNCQLAVMNIRTVGQNERVKATFNFYPLRKLWSWNSDVKQLNPQTWTTAIESMQAAQDGELATYGSVTSCDKTH